MLDFDLSDLELSERKKPVKWVAIAPPLTKRVAHAQRPTGPRKHRPRGCSIAETGSDAAVGNSTESASKQQYNNGRGSTPGVTDTAANGAASHGAAVEQQLNPARETRRTRKAKAKGLLSPHGPSLDIKPLKAAKAVVETVPPPPDLPRFKQENDAGNVEYKLRLKQPTAYRFQQLVTQLKFRLSEGNGECFYYLGVEDSGNLLGLDAADLAVSLDTLHAMAREVGAAAGVVRQLPGTAGCSCAIVRVARVAVQHLSCTDLRIAVAGSVDSGKSTLVACLTHGNAGRPLLDNGRGSARMAVFRHKHEIESGRTSSLSQQLLGYDAQGEVLNYSGVASMTPAEISQAAAHLLQFIDLGGHERYMKTALYGMTGMLPDYVLLAVSSLHGLGSVGRQHLAVALALELPLAIAITKSDLADQQQLASLTAEIREVLALAGKQGISACSQLSPLLYSVQAPVVMSDHQAAALACQMPGNRLSCLLDGGGGCLTVPIFFVSSVSGSGLALMHAFFKALPTGDTASSTDGASPRSADSRTDTSSDTAVDASPVHFQVDRTFDVKGVGSVVSGTAVAGSIAVGQRLLLGPNKCGSFSDVVVTCIQRSQVSVDRVKAGQSATLAIHPAAVHAGSSAEAAAATDEAASPAAELSTADTGASAAADASQQSSDRAAEATSHAQRQADTAYRIEMPQKLPAAVSFTGGRSEETEWSASFAAEDAAEAAAVAAAPEVEESAWLQERQQQREAAAVPWLRTSSHQFALQQLAADSSQLEHNTQQRQPKHGSCLAASDLTAASSGVSSPVAIPGSGSSGGVRGFGRMSSAPSLLDSSPTNSRKGAVLLDALMQPRTVWEFEAVIVLFSGHWPPRGLLSGAWPPQEQSGLKYESSGSDSDGLRLRAASASPPVPGASSGPVDSSVANVDVCQRPPFPETFRQSEGASVEKQRRRRSSGDRHAGSLGMFFPVVHCGSVRQAARVVAMREVLAEEAAQLGSSLASAIGAAAALASSEPSGGPIGDAAEEAVGCATSVTLRFVHRPEWLQAGCRLILRDRGDGCAAGAGVVRALHWSCEGAGAAADQGGGNGPEVVALPFAAAPRVLIPGLSPKQA